MISAAPPAADRSRERAFPLCSVTVVLSGGGAERGPTHCRRRRGARPSPQSSRRRASRTSRRYPRWPLASPPCNLTPSRLLPTAGPPDPPTAAAHPRRPPHSSCSRSGPAGRRSSRSSGISSGRSTRALSTRRAPECTRRTPFSAPRQRRTRRAARDSQCGTRQTGRLTDSHPGGLVTLPRTRTAR